jgi:hypothetical protein
MMTLARLLQDKKDAIADRWFDDVLSTYSDDASAAFRREKDPFANPVGGSLRTGTRGIVEALFDEEALSSGTVSEQIRGQLDGIVKIRAVQQFSVAQAVSFIFQLKEAVRAELGPAAGEPPLLSDLTRLDQQIDQMALAAFEIYVQCREQVCDLRVNEIKRRVSWVMKKLGQRGLGPEPAQTCRE